ncbi:MAG: hypothetical protein EVB02_01320 [SAR92 clade bacterium]|uniref:Uncharacterized protein n=1 Tax=SAR92 clade bacterium TaxID=2315479 RepID=A0A520LN66_9GAMM|nr:MAG: hypothetical protein EVB02_01320 [SAR92 clade bacterium]
MFRFSLLNPLYLFKFTFLLSFISVSYGQSTAQIDAPENWYQVEVILFNQPSNVNSETSNPSLPLKFSDNIIYLTNVIEEKQRESLMIEGALLPEITSYDPVSELEQHDKTLTQSIDSTSLEEDSFELNPSEDGVLEELVMEYEKEDLFIPEYEEEFQILDSKIRDLNDTARSLNRRGFNVFFHESWRFIADESDSQNWIVIGAGDQLDGRSEIEGSIRFYKSRFLHFEANLWKLIFPTNIENSSEQYFKLPDIPEEYEEERIFWKLSKLVENKTTEITEITENYEVSIENYGSRSDENIEQSNGRLKNLIAKDYAINRFEPAPDIEKTAPASNLLLDDLWTIIQSKRIDDGKLYYLDHPELGMIISAKSYEPKPINIEPENQSNSSPDNVGF